MGIMTNSAIVHADNDEENLADAPGSLVGWVDELIVVDMESTDRAVEIAREDGASELGDFCA
jgi:glycosyltransferase involved in cell wall biosynthesis